MTREEAIRKVRYAMENRHGPGWTVDSQWAPLVGALEALGLIKFDAPLSEEIRRECKEAGLLRDAEIFGVVVSELRNPFQGNERLANDIIEALANAGYQIVKVRP